MSEMPVIGFSGPVKGFGDVTAVGSADFNVHRGELFGVPCPNGADKTRIISLLTGLSRPDSGTIQIGGISLRNIRRM